MKHAKIIAGNWKMHHGPAATRSFFEAFDLSGHVGGTADAPGQADGAPGGLEGIKLLIFPPAISLAAAMESRSGSPEVALGVQNIHWENGGAFTGELSAEMAAEAGATHVLVGHSERRHVFGESDAETARKVKAALRAGVTPVVCVGETLEERKADQVEEVILRQLDIVLDALAEEGEGHDRFLLAYEPVWAIGTGETATPEDASAAHGTLRARLRDVLGDHDGEGVPILYGGSVKPDNAAELMEAPNVDGVLVGGASLDPESFAAIAAAGLEVVRR